MIGNLCRSSMVPCNTSSTFWIWLLCKLNRACLFRASLTSSGKDRQFMLFTSTLQDSSIRCTHLTLKSTFHYRTTPVQQHHASSCRLTSSPRAARVQAMIQCPRVDLMPTSGNAPLHSHIIDCFPCNRAPASACEERAKALEPPYDNSVHVCGVALREANSSLEAA